MTTLLDEIPIIEISSKIRARLHVAELVLNSLKIPYKIVEKTSPDYWKDRITKLRDNKRNKAFYG